MLTLFGAPALSKFRLHKIIDRIKKTTGLQIDLHAQFVYFIDSPKNIDKTNLKILEDLVGHYDKKIRKIESHEVIVTPRFGTISPWSSKATEIVKNCGLAGINRVERGIIYRIYEDVIDQNKLNQVNGILFDPMIETVFHNIEEAKNLFMKSSPKPFKELDIKNKGPHILDKANNDLGLALNQDELDYLIDSYKKLNRNPSDIELMMFAQANSEHCRHKIFNANWVIDKKSEKYSLFEMIKHTFRSSPDKVLSAYKDNSSVIEGHNAKRFFPSSETMIYSENEENIHIIMKVETHNHPTAIAPNPGAATGSGGEIRDEGATGRGAKPKAGLTGFSVSNLNIPKLKRKWESDFGRPSHIASALDIMIEAPIGSASYNNEFGRPSLLGYFRTYEEKHNNQIFGYHKPIMLAGGLGNIRENHIEKINFSTGTPLIVLGGPSMLIGLGGGAASSMSAGALNEDLDFASVQRANPEMERRCQEVIDSCWALGDLNPILFIHDVGAGGLSNALPELVHDVGKGAVLELRKIPNDDLGMAPHEIWCNESQERYVLAINKDQLKLFEKICNRERCPFALVGYATDVPDLKMSDKHFQNDPINIPMDLLLGKPPKFERNADHEEEKYERFEVEKIYFEEAAIRILQLPTVADKSFLITIGDRSISGLVHRDQMVGPWQVPVSDVAVTLSDYSSYYGEGMSIGERAPLAIIDAPASGRMAVGEAITNIAAAPIENLSDIKLSANWMAASGHRGEDAKLYDTVKAIGLDLCPSLGIAIPVGKDSMSMKTKWEEKGKSLEMTSPLSLVITAFAPVLDVRKTLTPQLSLESEDTLLILVDLGEGNNKLGGSCLAQTHKKIGESGADVRNPEKLKNFFMSIQELNKKGLLLAYHDRSDGGLFVTLCEMAFASNCGLDITMPEKFDNEISFFFSEELGAVLQIKSIDLTKVMEIFVNKNLSDDIYSIGLPTIDQTINLNKKNKSIFSASQKKLRGFWSETSKEIKCLRDNPDCATEEFNQIFLDNKGLFYSPTFDIENDITFPFIKLTKPKVAILREQGVNGHTEMAAAFYKAGFECVDVHMSDLSKGIRKLSEFHGLVACGGFSFGDVLGAGEGWSKSILFDSKTRDQFEDFFNNKNTFTLGVCNGCQMLANLREIIPGTKYWPKFMTNRSEQFEARTVMVEVQNSSSILLEGMLGSKMPIAVAHGEGRACFDKESDLSDVQDLVALRFLGNNGEITQVYPANPNGSPEGITALTNQDGRILAMMPHPERVIRTVTNSWIPREYKEKEYGPWMRMFWNARKWIN
tara:strand:+ start:78479 stop:82348 length:3870 start_codon:yes stop_codon:yes gene_type:complete